MAANDHPIPRSPPELLDLYIDASKDSFPALSQLSLVSKRCMLRARKHMFDRIQLGRIVRYPWGPGEEDYVEAPDVIRINDLLALLNANVMLATYPRYLDLDLGTFVGWDSTPGSDADFAFTQALPAILGSLHHLVSLRILSTGSNLPWDSLPMNMWASVTTCCSGPRITNLEFSGFTNFPFSLISSSPSLETLQLRVSGALVTPARAVPAQRIKTLISPVPCCSLIMSYTPETFAGLENFHWGVANQSDWDGYSIVSWRARDSLRRVKLEFKTGGHPISFDQGAPPLQGQVKHLTISSQPRIIIGGTPTFEPQTIFELIRYTLGFQQMLNSLESLTIEYSVPIMRLDPPMTDFIIGGNQDSWKALDDEISSSECRDRIKIEILFSVTVIKTRVEEGASEGTEEEYQVLEGRMVEEVCAAMPRTAGNGRLETSFTFASATLSHLCPHAAHEGFSFVQ